MTASAIINTGSGAVQLERVGDGYQGDAHSSTHGFMVDLDATAHDMKLSQTCRWPERTVRTYSLTFEAGAPFPNQAHLEVWFGGEKIFDLAPTGTMQILHARAVRRLRRHSNAARIPRDRHA